MEKEFNKQEEIENIKNLLNNCLELSKNLKLPETEQEQEALNNILSEINELNDYIDNIKVNKNE